ncbi:MAG TPA: diguanylate cyclase [Burkholderiales bacterium]|jgi:diguanylate cyclase (GGDEF)-like protein|nr:diguanylate cyclase [Burkholderiales bacterium]
MAAAVVNPEMPRVLVVDDSRIVRATIGKHVKNVYEVCEATDGEEGWTALMGDDQIRVVISDLSMPRLDGFGLIERIRASNEPRIRDVPIIMISGDDEAEPRRRASALGATAFITKGVGGGELLARLEALIGPAQSAPASAAPAPLAVPAPNPQRTAEEVAQQAHEAALAAQRAQDAVEAARVAAVEQAMSDPLTGLLTLSALVKQGAQLFAYARRHQLALSVMRIVLDDFGAMRAHIGDGVADQILVGVGKLLSSRMRKEDCVARTGPGEFAVALPAATRAGAARLAERLADEVKQAKILWQGQTLKITCSVGVADTVSDPGESFADIYSTAARRVERAREQGIGRVLSNDGSEESDTTVKPATPLEMAGLSVDQALRLLAEGRGAELEVHVAELARAVYPLVKFCDEMFEKAATTHQTRMLKASELLLMKTQPMETLKQNGYLD